MRPQRPKKTTQRNIERLDTHLKIDKLYFLKRCPLFKSLSDWEIRSISKLTRLVEIKKDDVVCREGDPGQAFSIVVSGRFEVSTIIHDEPKVLAYLKQGSYFGEMSLLTNQHHSATVQARSDSLILEIPKDKFKHIVENNASVSLEMSRVLSIRLKAETQRETSPQPLLRSDVISVFSLHLETGQTSFSTNLAASLKHETMGSTVLIDMSPSGRAVTDRLHISQNVPKSFFQDIGEDLNQLLTDHLVKHESGIDVLSLKTKTDEPHTPEFINHLINRLAVDYRFIVIELPGQMNDAVHKVINHSDFIFLATDNGMSSITEVQEIVQSLDKSIAGSDEKIKVIMIDTLLGFTPTNQNKRELFGKKDCFFLPQVSHGDEASSSSDNLYVLHAPDSEYAHRIRHIARKISNNLIGLALGSGAALGFAHVGIIKVLEREKIPIDFVAGSSMGALVASFYATGHTAADMEAIADSVGLWRLLNLIDFSIIPWRGVVIGRAIEKYLQKFLEDKHFEDTKIPLVLVGTDLHYRIPKVLNTGLISKALRASIAIPGIFHPVKYEGDYLIDGGVLDPLPVRPLLDFGVDKIIAVDVLPTAEDTKEKRKYNARIQQSKDQMVARKNLFVRASYKIRKKIGQILEPNFIDIVMNSMQAMEHEIADNVSADADVLIRPNMPLIHWAEFHRSKELIQRGEEAAEARLPELQALVKQQNI